MVQAVVVQIARADSASASLRSLGKASGTDVIAIVT
jgi:hypothetical protein